MLSSKGPALLSFLSLLTCRTSWNTSLRTARSRGSICFCVHLSTHTAGNLIRSNRVNCWWYLKYIHLFWKLSQKVPLFPLPNHHFTNAAIWIPCLTRGPPRADVHTCSDHFHVEIQNSELRGTCQTLRVRHSVKAQHLIQKTSTTVLFLWSFWINHEQQYRWEGLSCGVRICHSLFQMGPG